MILTLMSPIDINVPTRCAVVLVSKDSFVSLVTNLNSKNNVCKQWCLLLRFKLLTRFWILCSLLACKTMYLFPQVWAQKDQSQEKNFKSIVWWNISFWGKKLTTERKFFSTKSTVAHPMTYRVLRHLLYVDKGHLVVASYDI